MANEKQPQPQGKKRTCTRCQQEFASGDWTCKDGAPHTVESKTYHVSTEGLDVHYGPVTGDGVMNHARKTIAFVRGTHQSTDPQAQDFLDTYPGCITAERWREFHLSEDERRAQDKRTVTRLEQQNNDLLAQVQQLKEQNAGKPAQGAA